MAQKSPSTNTLATQSAWNKTPPPSPRLINETEFPTPGDAARIAAEERTARILALKNRKAALETGQYGEKTVATQDSSAIGAPPTPLSTIQQRATAIAQALPANERELAEESESNGRGLSTLAVDDSLFSPVLRGARARESEDALEKTGDAGHTVGRLAPSANRFDVLGLSDHVPVGEAVDAPTQPHEKLTHSTQKPEGREVDSQEGPKMPKPRKVAKKGKARKRGTPYDGRDSPLAGHKAQGRQARRASELRDELSGQTEEDPEWREVEDLDGLDISAFPDGTVLSIGGETSASGLGTDMAAESPGLPPLTSTRRTLLQLNSPAINVHSPRLTTPTTQPTPVALASPIVLVQAGMTTGDSEGQTRVHDAREHSVLHEQNAEMTIDDKGPHIITQPLPPHEPITLKIKELEFSFPADSFEPSRGNDPCYAYDNLDNEQMTDWPETPGYSFLVRLAGRGCPTAANEQARKEEIRSLLRRMIGIPAEARITAPAATAPFSGNRHPPHNFLVYNIDKTYFERTTEFRGCISTKEGTLFFAPNFPVFDTLLGSITGFGDATADQIHALVDRAFDKGHLDITLKKVIEGQDLGDLGTTEEAIARIRRSLGVRIVTPRSEGSDTIRAAHIFMDPPTHDIAQWREFREHAMNVSFKDPFLGMHITAFPGWLCGICTSKLHTTTICPILTEKGWLYNDDMKSRPQAKQQPAAPTARPTPLAFSTVQPGNEGDGNRQSRGGRGRGRGSRGRGDRGRGGRGRA
ncbi:hypothetical protein BC835DRAFT_1309148 [Cytidiella melzeri]|nr:hypothetical protein BC835DRAFT_1309148 [Cytidiella melzeri]